MKRILTIQDISCFGKCSLTVALPLLSAMGVETVILPTAVLSTHTLFKGFTCKDLSDQLKPITDHWKAGRNHLRRDLYRIPGHGRGNRHGDRHHPGIPE